MRRVLTTMLTLAICLVSLGAAPRTDDPGSSQAPESTQTSQSAPKAKKKHWYQIGWASWYGRKFHGKTTASGEPYNMYRLTAAHRTLPMGTWVKVTNLENDRTLVVRINDRGPVPKTRIIDLSYEAATLLGLRAYGILKVRLDVLPVPPVVASMNQNGNRYQSLGK